MAHAPHGYKKQRGLEFDDFASKHDVLRDHRPLGERWWRRALHPVSAAFVISVMTVLMWFTPLVWELLFIAALAFATCSFASAKTPDMPNKLPRDSSSAIDPKQIIPGSEGEKFGKPSGDMYLGIDRWSKKQVWFQFKDWLRHGLVTGTTGSGKTELLISIAYNFLCAGGSGLMFVDPKADSKVTFKLAWIAKRFGREDDLLICNYIAPRDIQNDYQLTNTCNPTQYGTVSEIANMLMAMLPKNDGGNNAVFADNAITLIKVLTSCLVDLRDKGLIILSWSVFRDHLNLDACLKLASNEQLNSSCRREMSLFVYGLAGVVRGKSASDQSNTAHEQFAYVASYCQRGLATLTGNFGFIYDCEFGDIAYSDVVRRNRIHLSVLPSLQNSPEELSMLGKIDLLGKKQALAQGLSSRLEGTSVQLSQRKISHDEVPSLNIMDEYKYISVPGMSIAATQGRSLGWASIVGVQSFAGLAVDGEHEADEWLENTSTKFIGSVQGSSTFDKFNKIVGQEYVARTDGRTREHSPLGGPLDKNSINFEKHSVLDIRDLRAQTEGQFTLIVGDREIRMQSMFVKTPLDSPSKTNSRCTALLMNAFVDLPPLTNEEIDNIKNNVIFYEDWLSGKAHPVVNASHQSQALVDAVDEITRA